MGAEGDRAEKEAADWFARLNTLSVSAKALEEFQAWRKNPANDAAYERLEAVWSASGSLARDPDILKGVADALARGRRRWFGSRPLHAGFGLAAATAAALLFALLLARGEAYVTEVGEQRLVRLEDGSRLRLDTATKVRVRFSKDRRAVELVRGQAYFDVAPDAARPFVVRADDVAVRALGTQFDVRRQGAAVQVTLVEGRVEVVDVEDGGVWRLTPGEGLQADGAAVRPPRPVDVAQATSWTRGQLIFRATPLSEAVAEVNRYSRRRVVLEPSELRSVPVNGVFEAGDTEAFVAAVSELFQLDVQAGKAEVRLAARS